jgi:hypothetical protein
MFIKSVIKEPIISADDIHLIPALPCQQLGFGVLVFLHDEGAGPRSFLRGVEAQPRLIFSYFWFHLN